MIFVDFTKVFNTVIREVLWNILWKLRYLDHLFRLVSALHTGIMGSVSLRRELLKPFEVGNSVKPGCVLAPASFSIFLSMVLFDAFTDSTQEIRIPSRLESGVNLFNASQFKSTKKTRNIPVQKLIFADDTTFMAYNH